MHAMPNGQREADVLHHGVVPVVQVQSVPQVAEVLATVVVQGEQVAVSAHRPGHHAGVRPLERPARVHARAAAAREAGSHS